MPETKQCQKCQSNFIIEDEDFEFYEKMKVPAPTWCPECRFKRRISFRNEKTLYKRKCAATGKVIFSAYSKDTPGEIFNNDYWWSDNWDALKYAQGYDFSEPFFKQLKVLSEKVPRIARTAINLINSDYSMNAGDLKDCYLIFNAANDEDCAYGTAINNSKKCYDNSYLESAELCYENVLCEKCYTTFYSVQCSGCQNVYFSKNLKNCNDCFGCVNLRNKSYCIFNKQYSKEEYKEKIKEFQTGSYTSCEIFKKETKKLFLKFPNKYFHGEKNINSTGDYIYNSKNVHNSYFVSGGENMKYCQLLRISPSKDCYDYTLIGKNAELVYDSLIVGRNVSNIKFCHECYENAINLEYCVNCSSSSNCFGCVGLRKKQYCILNKQYTKEEYFKMVERIKKHMDEMPYIDKNGNEYKYGEFFPSELSPFAYNETIAQEYFPLTKKEAKKQGCRWKDSEKKDYQITITAKDLPDNISHFTKVSQDKKDVDDSILKEIIGCNTKSKNREQTGCATAFKVIPKELEFYKKLNIPLPRYCPNCRHHERLKNRNPLKLYKQTCQKEGCNTEFETTYTPDRKDVVYCEKCYNKEMV